MKIRLLFLFVTAICVVDSYSQDEGIKIPFPSNLSRPVYGYEDASRTSVACGPDTIVYPYLKELVFNAPNDSFFVDAMVGSVRTASQAYHMNSAVDILGVQFWGAAYSTSPNPQTLLVRTYLYAVDAFNMPTTKLDSADVVITEAYDFYEAVFAVPHAYNQNFAVAVKSVPNDTLAVITNNAGQPWHIPYYGESLGWRRFGSGTWNSSLSFFGQDLEYMIFPIVSYNIDADFTVNDDTLCLGDTVDFTNTSSSIFGNRMFNLNAFDEYFGLTAADSSFSWNFGDGPLWTSALNAEHVYASSGSYTSKLRGEMVGYFTTCVDTATIEITMAPFYNDTAFVTICAGDSYSFGTQTLNTAGVYNEPFQSVYGCDSLVTLNLAVNNVDISTSVTPPSIMANAAGAGYQWIDCNNGNLPLSGEVNQSFTPLSTGSYAVIIADGGCSDTSACINISVGIDENSLPVFTIYPNPTSGRFQLNTNGIIVDRVLITTMIGEVVHTTHPTTSTIPLDIHEMANGIYFIRVDVGEQRQVLRLIKQ